MAVNKVDLHISQIKQDLADGLTWLASEDLGYGSIQSKYGAKEFQIKMIQKHPKLEGLEPDVTVFQIIDDEKEPENNLVVLDIIEEVEQVSSPLVEL